MQGTPSPAEYREDEDRAGEEEDRLERGEGGGGEGGEGGVGGVVVVEEVGARGYVGGVVGGVVCVGGVHCEDVGRVERCGLVMGEQ